METWPKNFKLIQYNELDSTNSEAKRLAFKDEINTVYFLEFKQMEKEVEEENGFLGPKI